MNYQISHSPKPKTPIKKQSPNKYSTQTFKSQIHQRKLKTILTHPALDILAKQLSQHRSKLIPHFQIYDLLKVSNLPQRCLAHNNELSLYCFNEKRLLCVNCIYGGMKHRNHRVGTIKDSRQDITRQVSRLQNQIEKQLQILRVQQLTAKNNIKQLEQILVFQLQNLQKEFDLISKLLTNKYIEIKKRLIQTFHQIMGKHKVVSEQFAWLNDSLVITLSKMDKSGDNIEDVRRHSLLSNILDYCKLRSKPIQREQIQLSSQELTRQLIKLKQFLQRLDK